MQGSHLLPSPCVCKNLTAQRDSLAFCLICKVNAYGSRLLGRRCLVCTVEDIRWDHVTQPAHCPALLSCSSVSKPLVPVE